MKITFLKSHNSKRFHILKNRKKLAKPYKYTQKVPLPWESHPFKHWPVILEKLSFEIPFTYLLIEQICVHYIYVVPGIVLSASKKEILIAEVCNLYILMGGCAGRCYIGRFNRGPQNAPEGCKINLHMQTSRNGLLEFPR